MAESGFRILFVPVSGPYGMGEFARCSAIASAALERWPEASVHFLLSREAPYAARLPFPATLLPASATFHSAEVIACLQTFRPAVVIFDNAGRSAQLQAAQRQGARIVFISSRRRQRRRAFRLSWMRLLDEHWIAYPKLIAGELRFFERAKLKLLGRPAVRYLDVIMARAGADRGAAARGEILVIPGGGTGHPGAQDAAAQFLIAAQALAASGCATTFVGPSADGANRAHLHCVPALPQSELVARMRAARLVLANGGSTLLQAIACGAPCVAAPIAGDQLERIRACVAAGVAVQAAAQGVDLEAKARALLNDEPARTALARRAGALGLADGIQVALAALEAFRQRI